jgi:hypothetical protein
MKAKFTLGQVVATPGALDALTKIAGENWREQLLHPLIQRHLVLDQGALDDEDQKSNEQALIDETRVFSSYLLPDGSKIWIITEADRSVTTLLLPEEY